MKFISWNVDGIRSAMDKGFMDYIKKEKADILCLQNTQYNGEDTPLKLKGYYQYWSPAVAGSESGTVIFSKEKAVDIFYGFDDSSDLYEDRIMTFDFGLIFVVNVYLPNGPMDSSEKWDKKLKDYLLKLEAIKPLILCGDLNSESRASGLIKAGFTDTLSYFKHQNIKNRVNYILTSKELDRWLLGADIHRNVSISTHSPVHMDIM